MLTRNEILETIEMLDGQNLDVRTITLAVSLFDCIRSTAAATARCVYDKLCRVSQNLVAVGDEISAEYGVPIINKRISVTPISLIGAASGEFLPLAHALDRAATTAGVDFIGGYSALVHKQATEWESVFMRTIPEALATTKRVCGSLNVASSKSGINMDAVRDCGVIIKELAALTKTNAAIGCAKFVVFCNAVDDNPFMAGAFNGVGEGDCVINVGVSGPGVVESAISKCPDADLSEIGEIIKKTAFKITRAGQLVGTIAAKRLGVSFGIVDLSLAPTPKTRDSVAHILQEIGLESVGAHGTTAALALLNDSVKKGGIMASGSVGGLSGAFIPVSEDAGMIEAAQNGRITFDKLEAMTSVCSVGLDMIAVPESTTAEVISAIIADECAIGMVNNKTTAVRLIPYGEEGGRLEFGGLLGSAPVMRVSTLSPARLVARGGRIPAPLHSHKN